MIDFSGYQKIVVELGMGDGRVLEGLAELDLKSLFVGIELDAYQCSQARSRITLPNITILNGSFEDIVLKFPDHSVDLFIAVLPDPAYIDEKKEQTWKPFYRTVYSKLKRGGAFRLVTEITDELLQPVSNDQYAKWAENIKAAFQSIGFSIAGEQEGASTWYSSRCLDQFRGDPERIRIMTLELTKTV
jgi:tRNA G46 methylase TrmB